MFDLRPPYWILWYRQAYGNETHLGIDKNPAILDKQVIAYAYNSTVSIRLRVNSEGARYPYPDEYKCTECCQRPIPRMILDSTMPTMFMLLLLDPPSSPPCQWSLSPNDYDKLNVGYVRENS